MLNSVLDTGIIMEKTQVWSLPLGHYVGWACSCQRHEWTEVQAAFHLVSLSLGEEPHVPGDGGGGR